MKKIITTMLLASTMIATAQEKFTTYFNANTNKEYRIDLSTKDEDKFTLYIDCFSVDKMVSKGGIMINNKRYADFIAAINTAKAKYIEWVETAKANNVKELEKDIQAKAGAEAYFQYGSSWNFDFSVKLTFDFKIVEKSDGVKYYLRMWTDKLESSSNQFIDSDGFLIIFESVEEIEKFLDTITLDKINEARNKPKADGLFKD